MAMASPGSDDDYDFVDEVPDMYGCPICHTTRMVNPYHAQDCGHAFCKTCIDDWIRMSPAPSRCPVDNKPINRSKIFPDLRIKREMSKLQVRCKYKSMGCKAVSDLSDIQAHIDKCEYKPVMCTSGCGENVASFQIEKHKTDECLKRAMMCDVCGESFEAGEMLVHAATCEVTEVLCEVCASEPMTRCKLEEHQKCCSKTKPENTCLATAGIDTTNVSPTGAVTPSTSPTHSTDNGSSGTGATTTEPTFIATTTNTATTPVADSVLLTTTTPGATASTLDSTATGTSIFSTSTTDFTISNAKGYTYANATDHTCTSTINTTNVRTSHANPTITPVTTTAVGFATPSMGTTTTAAAKGFTFGSPVTSARGSIFGDVITPTTNSLFRSTNTRTLTGCSLFGTTHTPATSYLFSTNTTLFGASNTAVTSSLFGASKTSVTSSLFGANDAPVKSSPFGANDQPATNSLFAAIDKAMTSSLFCTSDKPVTTSSIFSTSTIPSSSIVGANTTPVTSSMFDFSMMGSIFKSTCPSTPTTDLTLTTRTTGRTKTTNTTALTGFSFGSTTTTAAEGSRFTFVSPKTTTSSTSRTTSKKTVPTGFSFATATTTAATSFFPRFFPASTATTTPTSARTTTATVLAGFSFGTTTTTTPQASGYRFFTTTTTTTTPTSANASVQTGFSFGTTTTASGLRFFTPTTAYKRRPTTNSRTAPKVLSLANTSTTTDESGFRFYTATTTTTAPLTTASPLALTTTTTTASETGFKFPMTPFSIVTTATLAESSLALKSTTATTGLTCASSMTAAVCSTFGSSLFTPATSTTRLTSGTVTTSATTTTRLTFGTVSTPGTTTTRLTFGTVSTPATTTTRLTFGTVTKPASSATTLTFGTVTTPANSATRLTFGTVTTPASSASKLTFGTVTTPASISTFGSISISEPATSSIYASITGTTTPMTNFTCTTTTATTTGLSSGTTKTALWEGFKFTTLTATTTPLLTTTISATGFKFSTSINTSTLATSTASLSTNTAVATGCTVNAISTTTDPLQTASSFITDPTTTTVTVTGFILPTSTPIHTAATTSASTERYTSGTGTTCPSMTVFNFKFAPIPNITRSLTFASTKTTSVKGLTHSTTTTTPLAITTQLVAHPHRLRAPSVTAYTFSTPITTQQTGFTFAQPMVPANFSFGRTPGADRKIMTCKRTNQPATSVVGLSTTTTSPAFGQSTALSQSVQTILSTPGAVIDKPTSTATATTITRAVTIAPTIATPTTIALAMATATTIARSTTIATTVATSTTIAPTIAIPTTIETSITTPTTISTPTTIATPTSFEMTQSIAEQSAVVATGNTTGISDKTPDSAPFDPVTSATNTSPIQTTSSTSNTVTSIPMSGRCTSSKDPLFTVPTPCSLGQVFSFVRDTQYTPVGQWTPLPASTDDVGDATCSSATQFAPSKPTSTTTMVTPIFTFGTSQSSTSTRQHRDKFSADNSRFTQRDKETGKIKRDLAEEVKINYMLLKELQTSMEAKHRAQDPRISSMSTTIKKILASNAELVMKNSELLNKNNELIMKNTELTDELKKHYNAFKHQNEMMQKASAATPSISTPKSTSISLNATNVFTKTIAHLYSQHQQHRQPSPLTHQSSAISTASFDTSTINQSPVYSNVVLASSTHDEDKSKTTNTSLDMPDPANLIVDPNITLSIQDNAIVEPNTSEMNVESEDIALSEMGACCGIINGGPSETIHVIDNYLGSDANDASKDESHHIIESVDPVENHDSILSSSGSCDSFVSCITGELDGNFGSRDMTESGSTIEMCNDAGVHAIGETDENVGYGLHVGSGDNLASGDGIGPRHHRIPGQCGAYFGSGDVNIEADIMGETGDNNVAPEADVNLHPVTATSLEEVEDPVHSTAADPRDVDPVHPTAADPPDVDPVHPTAADPPDVDPVHSTAADPRDVDPVHPTAADPRDVDPVHPTAADPRDIDPVHPTAADPPDVDCEGNTVGHWTCVACMFRNHNCLKLCDVCDLPKCTIGEGEEVEIFCEQAKLYDFDTTESQWKERAIGQMKILHNETTKKYRVLLLKHETLKVSCNHFIARWLFLKPIASTKCSWCWVCTDNTTETPVQEQFAVRFTTSTLANKFKDVFESCVLDSRARYQQRSFICPDDDEIAMMSNNK